MYHPTTIIFFITSRLLRTHRLSIPLHFFFLRTRLRMALASGSSASTVERLHQAIRLLDAQLRHDVVSRHPKLLSQLSSLSDVDIFLSSFRLTVFSLYSEVVFFLMFFGRSFFELELKLLAKDIIVILSVQYLHPIV